MAEIVNEFPDISGVQPVSSTPFIAEIHRPVIVPVPYEEQ